jgi:hypothetical protein
MLRLFIVAYQTHFETHVDMGRAVVCADTSEKAMQAVVTKYSLLKQKTKFSVETVDDGIMLLTRRAVARGAEPPLGRDNAPPHAPGEERKYAPTLQYNCQVLAISSGQDEFHALKRLAHTVINRCNEQSGDQDRHVTRLMMTAEPRMPGHDKLKSIEEFGLYKGKGLIR